MIYQTRYMAERGGAFDVINMAIFSIYSLFVQLFKMALALCLSNFLIPRVATEEFMINTENQQTNMVISAMIMTAIICLFMSILIIAGPETMNSFFNNSIVHIVIISLWVIGTVIAILTFKKSYLRTVNKVRLTK